jgi:branched-chain amino acid transport system ATP-binding protein
MTDAALLKLSGVRTFYHHVEALRGIDMTVSEGEIVTLIGSNGAGKTTTLRTISGLMRPRHGTVHFGGDDVTGTDADRLVRAGIGHAPEGRRIFSRLTVHENLQMGAFTRTRSDMEEDLDRVMDLFPRLRERQTQRGGTLSGGEQQMLAIARALMCRPKLLLLDEPSLGLAPILVKQIFSIIAEINHQGTTVLLVEQNAHQALRIAHRAYVLQTGRVILEGAAGEVAANPDVQRAYLGEA